MGVIHPLKLIFLSLLVWLFFYVQMSVEYLYDGSTFFPIFTVVVFILSFTLGMNSLKTNKIKQVISHTHKQIKQIVFLFFLMGLIGVFLKIYVGFFKSGIFLADDIFEQRLENMGKELSGGLIGVLASVMFPFSFITLLISLYNYKKFSKLYLFIIAVLGSYPFVETFYMGGRTIIALLGTTFLFVCFATYQKYSKADEIVIKANKLKLLKLPKFLLKKTVIIPLVLIALLFTTYSINVVAKRLNRFGYGDKTFRVWERKDYQWVKFDKDFKKGYFKSSQDEKDKMIGLHSLKHYFVHGAVEYVRLVNDLEKKTGYYYGQYEFNVFFKFFRIFKIPLKSLGDLNEIVKRKSVYQTFWGPFYIDFGLFGVIILFFWGRFVKRIYIKAKMGSTPHVIFYGYLSTILITSAFLNFLLGSSGYYLFAFLVSLLVFDYFPVINLKTIKK